jgi:SAM-dependent methyltransferase
MKANSTNQFPKSRPISNRDGERIDPKAVSSLPDYVSFLKHLKAYEYLKNFTKTDSVLEIGCGTGYGTIYASQWFKNIDALDVEPQLIESLKNSHHPKNINFQFYDGKKIPFKDQSFNLVFSFQVIEHVNDDIGFLKEIYRVLKPGGTAVVTTPNRLYRLKENQKPFNPFHVREYSPKSLEDLATRVFTKLEISSISGNEEIQQIEYNRVKSGFGKYDYLGARKWLPQRAIKVGAKLIRIALGKNKRKDFNRDDYSIEDFSINQKDHDRALDLILIGER